jgi:hypothetical protein
MRTVTSARGRMTSLGASISELEASKLDVRLDTLSRVAIALNVTMADLFDEAKRS